MVGHLYNASGTNGKSMSPVTFKEKQSIINIYFLFLKAYT